MNGKEAQEWFVGKVESIGEMKACGEDAVRITRKNVNLPMCECGSWVLPDINMPVSQNDE